MYKKKFLSSPTSENPEKKLNLNSSLNSSTESFQSALSSSFESISSEMATNIDQDIGTAPDFVSLICVEVTELNGEDLKSPALNVYDAIILYRS